MSNSERKRFYAVVLIFVPIVPPAAGAGLDTLPSWSASASCDVGVGAVGAWGWIGAVSGGKLIVEICMVFPWIMWIR
jgi:hypothetical protein